jgi:Zn ribbon nucleic-acid-binding protein
MKANILLPGSNPDKSDERCPVCSQMLYYWKGQILGSLICVHCGFQKKIEDRPKAELTSDDHTPMLVQPKGKKGNADWPEIPKSAVIVQEFDLSNEY